MLIRLKKCFTLVEVLVALAVSSIAITAAYSSYQLVADQYAKNTDLSDMHATGRSIMAIIKRDIRMAGFEYRDDNGVKVNGGIPNPLVIKDSGNACCDSAEITYDYYDEYSKKLERRKISYYTKPYSNNKGNRNRLYKKVDILDKSNSVIRAGSEQPMADFIEDFQLVGTTGGNYIFALDNNLLHVYDLSKPGPSNNIASYVKTVTMSDNTHQGGSMVLGPDGNIYFAIFGNYQWDIAVLNPQAVFDSSLKLIERIKSPQARVCNFNPWLGFIGNELYIDSCKSQNPYAYVYDISTKKLTRTIDQQTQELYEIFSPTIDTSKDGMRCNMSGNKKYASCSSPGGRNFSTSFYGTYPRVIKFMENNLLAYHSYNGAVFFNQLSNSGGSALSGGKLMVPQTQNGQSYKAKTYNLVQADLTKSQSLIDIGIIVRSKNKHSSQNKQFSKKTYWPGNFLMTKNDRYEREFFHSSVVARNMAL